MPRDVIYLNHGSFGPAPLQVQAVRQEWSERLQKEPFDFFVRQMEAELLAASEHLGEFLGTTADNLVFLENATIGMNLVAASTELQPGDEVLTTSHAYGAVLRIWRTVCKRTGAKLIVHDPPIAHDSPTTVEELVDSLFAAVTKRTKLLVIDHISSLTAVIFPVKEICRRARLLGLSICVDGPHALAVLPLNLEELDCDYYLGSGHKWLSAPFGSGFLYAHPRAQQALQPVVVSWGGSLSGVAPRWQDDFYWPGTRDPAANLAMPSAIDYLRRAGMRNFRRRTHGLARYARHRIAEVTGLQPEIPDSPEWYGSMISLPLPLGEGPPPKRGVADPLQKMLWEQHRIEVPVMHWRGRRFLRVSCHLYTLAEEIDRLTEALRGGF